MSNRNSDGTYKLPDKSVSLVWQSDKGKIVNRWGEYWVLPNSSIAASAIGERWLPWTPPTFPVRKRTELRRARVRLYKESDIVIAVRASVPGTQTPWRAMRDGWGGYYDQDVTVVEWLDPEYEDETPRMENISNGVQIESSK